MLTDENDCSAIEGGQYWVVKDRYATMPRARTECKTDPTSKCCVACVQAAPADCPPDPNCSKETPWLNEWEDNTNLRCFDQKRRFGINFLYPIQRYVNALTQRRINPQRADLELGDSPGVENPIFSDLQPNDENTGIRDKGFVFLAGIVGVPWQDIAKNRNNLTAGYKSSTDLSKPDPELGGKTGWDLILGDPDKNVPPLDPHMIETTEPRTGRNPLTGDQLAGPEAGPGADKINGHEYTPWEAITPNTPKNPYDLQYACTFDLKEERNCADGSNQGCDCEPKIKIPPPTTIARSVRQTRATAAKRRDKSERRAIRALATFKY